MLFRSARDASDHPIPELATWAATGFLTGYCVRRVEESWPTANLEHSSSGECNTNDAWETSAASFANQFAANQNSTIIEHSVVCDALDDVIAREIDKRAEHVREQVTPADWEQFESFIGWWVLHGYAIRAVER